MTRPTESHNYIKNNICKINSIDIDCIDIKKIMLVFENSYYYIESFEYTHIDYGFSNLVIENMVNFINNNDILQLKKNEKYRNKIDKYVTDLKIQTNYNEPIQIK
jgi:hypothetical protein